MTDATPTSQDAPEPSEGHDGPSGPSEATEQKNPDDKIEYEKDEDQDWIDRDTIDFDPDDGLLSGTSIDGTSEIPGPHERGEDTVDESQSGESKDNAGDSDSDSDADTGDADGDATGGQTPSGRSDDDAAASG